ncbi:protein VAC14 homolog isoform X2 [Arctopsyche grandis]|uniref:protein VAC14 homolog isoform X2 n=1 Tax=Arctopsyche grandis TaxID=121162 RepID=UPI00406D93C5
MSEREHAPLSAACVRALTDKLYDKNKAAAVEIEKMVRDFRAANNTNQIKRLLRVLGQDFATAQNPHIRKGSSLGLAAVAVALGPDCSLYLGDLMPPILACFSDPEIRVRYFACEALYNVSKVMRGAILVHFTDIFNALSKCATDPDQNLKTASELLDRLLKDIVTESASFDLCAFVPLLRERIYSRNSFARQFIISWVSVLDSVPDIDLIIFLPEILDGLFKIMDDPMPEIKKMCGAQLGLFLQSIKTNPSRVDFPSMINILIVHAQATDEVLQFTAITWIKEFVQLSGTQMLPHISGILTAVLPCLSYNDESRKNIKETALTVNYSLMKLISLEPNDPKSDSTNKTLENIKTVLDTSKANKSSALYDQLALSAIVEVLNQLLHHNSVQTKVAVLRWILHLYNKVPTKMSTHTEEIFDALLGCLSDPSDDVVRQSLAVLPEICSTPSTTNTQDIPDVFNSPYYRKFLLSLLTLFSCDMKLLDDRGAFIIRQLCVLLNAEDIYRTMSEILLEEKNLKFAATMVETLNMILLTSAELLEMRNRLKESTSEETAKLFVCLYRCWCHNPVALLALCLLTHNYIHCNQLIELFGTLEITIEFLTDIDKLVQLIESPIFAYLRLELLTGTEAKALRNALYGLLMLLPQTEAFHILRKRLQSIPQQLEPFVFKHSTSRNLPNMYVKNFDELLKHFLDIQEKHRFYKLNSRTKNMILSEQDYS